MRRRKKKNYLTLLIVLVVGLGVGYALISSNLTINGIGRFNNQNWDVHFEDLTLNPGNVQLSEGDVAASIDQTTMTDITFTVTLQEPGDFYEFEVAAVNAGSMDAMIGLVTNNLNGNPISDTNPVPTFASYTATYSDGVEIAPNHLLEAGYSETYKVRVEYRTDINPEDLPDEVQELTFNFGVQYVQKDANTVIDVPHPETLYGVLESYAQEGTYAAKYTGEHQDSFAGNGNKEIYHWYANSNTNGEAILNKNNVIFAGQCWQMIRTTDTGGVKLIYNGEVENNQCLNTRGTHIGYSDRTTQTLNSSYYYGTDYTYDAENNVFALSGTVEQSTWNASTGPTLIGKYTCKSSSETGTCATLYLIESYNSATQAYVFPISKNSHYSQFGKLAYNNNSNSPAYVGYMYNDAYPVVSKSNQFYITEISSWTVNTSYYYSDTIDWNTTTANQYTLLNPQSLSSLNGDYSSLVGKYIMYNSIETHGISAIYVTAVESNVVYYKYLSKGDLNTSLTIGDSYTESGGVYTLSGNVTNITYIDWYNNISDYSIYKGKYVCGGNNTSCSDIKHISPINNPKKKSYYYFDTTTTWSFAESVSYNGSSYTLSGDIKTFWDFFDSTNQSYWSTHHYTCLGNGTSCSTVRYVYYFSDTNIFYVELSNVVDIETALNNMLYASNVNTKDSLIKMGIEAWYAKYLSGYDEYIEDTIFCNNRTINTLGGWSSDGEVLNLSPIFQESTLTMDLSCDRVTDQFSTLNNSAKLTYKIGLMSSPEKLLFKNSIILNSGNNYWLNSPEKLINSYAGVMIVNSDMRLTGDYTSNRNGVRPSISLIPGITYTSGDGSMTSPFVIE